MERSLDHVFTCRVRLASALVATMKTDEPGARPQKTKRLIGFIVVAFLLSVAAFLPFATTASSSRDFYFFDVDMTSDQGGITQVYFDMGRGMNETESFSQTLEVSDHPIKYRYLLPIGRLRQIRFDFSNVSGHYSFSNAAVDGRAGKVVLAFSPSDFHPDSQIKELRVDGTRVDVATIDKADDPYIYLTPPRSLKLRLGWLEIMLLIKDHFLYIFGGILLLGVLAEAIWQRGQSRIGFLIQSSRSRPRLIFALVAAASVMWQLHPIIFSGKSFVSPNITYLLYDRIPTLPGYTSQDIEDPKGTDSAAMMYQHVHFPSLEKKAIFTDHELPLWNRYDLAGTPLLGQGQSMFGEILNIIPMLAGSAAWAWDLKFILARWLFAFSLALFVYKATNHKRAAGIIALVAPWIGYFTYKANHPAQFAVCFGPLILLAWAQIASAQGRKALGWGAVWLFLANWEVITSGTVKEAYMTAICLDVAGLFYLFAKGRSLQFLRPRLLCVTVTAIIFVLISAPLWWIFLDTLAMSATSYDTPLVRQIPLWESIGIFEDMFYRHLNPSEIHGNPSTNILVFLGVTWILASLLFRKNRVGIALAIAAAIPGTLAFGIVPASVLLKTPFLSHIYHVGNTFSCPLIILLISGAGLGFADFLATREIKLHRPTAVAALVLIGLAMCCYWARAPRITSSPFYTGYLPGLGLSVIALLILLFYRPAVGRAAGFVLWGVCVWLLVWRHGTYNHIAFDDYVFNPPVRADLHAPSPAITTVAELEKEPERIAGLGMNLYCGSQQLYFQEGIYGIEAVRSGPYDAFCLAVGLPKVNTWGKANFGGERASSRGAMDMLNVRYYIDSVENRQPLAGLREIAVEDLQIYESPTAWPRAFFTNNIINEAGFPDLIQHLDVAAGNPFAAVSSDETEHLHDLNIYRPAQDGITTTPARDYKLSANTTAFTVDASSAGLIVLSETYYPNDFRAYLNDKPAEYLRVNHAFKAIAVSSPGTYEVRFEYWPHHLTDALWLFASGLIIGGASILFLWRGADRAFPLGERTL